MEFRGSGDALQALPQKRHRAPELWRLAAGVATWRKQRYRALEMRCRRCLKRGMERWSSSVLLLLLKFLAFVRQGLRLRHLGFRKCVAS